MFLRITQCTKQSVNEVSILKIAHGPVTLLAVFHFLPLNTLWSSKYNKKISTVYIKVKLWYSIPAPPLLSALESRNRYSLLYNLQNYCHPPYTATNCGGQTVVLYRDWSTIFCMKLYKISCCVEWKKRFVINFFLSAGYNYKCLFIMKVMGACYVCNGILVGAGHLNSKYAFVCLWNMNRFYLWFSDIESVLRPTFVLEHFRTHTGA